MSKNIQRLMQRMAAATLAETPPSPVDAASPDRSRGHVRLVRPKLGADPVANRGASSLTERVADLLSDHEAMASDQLAKRLAVAPARVQLELLELEALGLVVRTPVGWLLG